MLRSEHNQHVPEGNFSVFYFAKNLLPFTFVKELTMGAKKKLFIHLCESMFSFSTAVVENWAKGVHTVEDKEVLHDIKAMMDDPAGVNRVVSNETLQGIKAMVDDQELVESIRE